MIEDPETRILRQENAIYRLQASLARAQKRVADLQRHYDAAQRCIERLRAQVKRAPKDEAERVFGNGGK